MPASRPRRWWRGLTAPHPALTDIEQMRQARLLSGVLLVLIVLGIVVEAGTTAMLAAEGYTGYYTTLVGLGWMALLYALSRTRRVQTAAVLFVSTASLIIFAGALVEPRGVPGGYLDYLMLPIWLGSVFLTDCGLLWVIGANLAGLLAFAFLSPAFAPEQILVGPFTYVAAGSALMFVLRRHRNQVERDRRAELAENEQRYRTLVEQIPAITYLDELDETSPTGITPLYLSPQFEAWLGYTFAEYQHDPGLWHTIVHPDDRARVADADQRLFENGGAQAQDYRLVARDGRVLWVRDEARLRETGDGRKLVQGILLDITEQVGAEQRIRREAARAQALLRVAGRLNAQLDLDALLTAISDEAAQALNTPNASVWLYDDQRAVFYPAGGTGGNAVRFRFEPMPRALFEQYNALGEPVIVVPDIRAVPGLPSAELYRERDMRSAAIARMEYEGALIGTLNVTAFGAEREFSEDERLLLRGLADQAALAIVNTRLYKDAQRRLEHLQALLSAAARLNSQLDLDSLLATICHEAAQALKAPSASVWLYNERAEHFYPAAGTGEVAARSQVAPIPRALYERYETPGDPVLIVPDIRAVPGLPSVEMYREWDMHTVAIAKMSYETTLIGTLNILTFGAAREFSRDEQLLLRGLADQGALAIVNTRLYKDARRRLEHLQALRAIDVAITSNRNLQETLNVLLEQITSRLEVDAALVLLLNPPGTHLEFVAGRGFRTQALQFTRLPVGQGNAGLAAQRRTVIGLPDLQGDPQAFVHAPLLAQEGFVSYYAAPLVADEKLQGVLEVFHRWPLGPDAEWLSFLEALAGQAAIAIDSTSLFSDLQKANAELSAAYDATIEGWSHALDLRDRETEGHTQRVTEMTLALARAAGITGPDLVHIRRGALLHDIGKMGIPDSILNKPGPLTEEEWQFMRQHPAYAYEMLWPIAYLRPALDIPWCHHEKWDGTGYPRGLVGEQIPLAARLFAVVDVWDALRSNRPYRSGWPEAQVREYIRLAAGRHFDPEAVALFLGMLGEERAGQ